MTKINISPKWYEVKPQGFYVYIHSRASDGRIFYVGKGQGRRGFSAISRNRKWRFIAIKHGVKVEVCQSNMNEEGAHLLEMWLISKFKNKGINLSNMTEGGEGRSGHVSYRRKLVYCSNGMTFLHAKDASDWLKTIGHVKAGSKAISAACNGSKCIVYGFTWSHHGKPDMLDIPEGVDYRHRNCGIVNAIVVYRSDGKRYKSGADAAEDLGKARKWGSRIMECCRGVRGSFCGYTWSFKNGDFPEYIDPYVKSSKHKEIKIKCCNGMVFESIKSATEWLSVKTGKTYSDSAIQQSMRRGTPIKGYTFQRISKSRRRKSSE